MEFSELHVFLLILSEMLWVSQLFHVPNVWFAFFFLHIVQVADSALCLGLFGLFVNQLAGKFVEMLIQLFFQNIGWAHIYLFLVLQICNSLLSSSVDTSVLISWVLLCIIFGYGGYVDTYCTCFDFPSEFVSVLTGFWWQGTGNANFYYATAIAYAALQVCILCKTSLMIGLMILILLSFCLLHSFSHLRHLTYVGIPLSDPL